MITPDKHLTQDEQQVLETTLSSRRISHLRDTTLIMFMLKTGARPQESLNIQWSDINFPKKTVFINTMKGGIDRCIPMDDELYGRLLELSRRTPKDVRPFPISYSMFYKVWRRYRPVKKKLHCLRHTFAVNLYDSCEKISLVQQALGHAHIHTTSVYLQIQHSVDELRRHI